MRSSVRVRHVLAVGVVLAALAGCGSADPAGPPAGGPPPGGSPPPGGPPPGGPPPPGMPPPPDRATAEAYVADLRQIDAAIVGDGDIRRLVDRGLNQCASVKEWPDDQAKLVALTNQRFTAPDHPDGFGEATAARILEVVRKRICPAY
ncbi:hypothetical protein ACQP2Y_33445 [Actinoplanes sp. CA-051413]|uniref:hypothetical protein n=1 Tax=Actinoplanes sp. CA-051413 TaxID=3239899 RepID=UPI003D984894